MKTDYKNRIPKGMALTCVIVTAVFLFLFLFIGLTGLVFGTLKTVLFIVFLVCTLIALGVSVWMIFTYRAFSYDGKRQISRRIIEGIAKRVKLEEGEKGLDIKTPTLIQFNYSTAAYLQAG
ncbi:MAG: hypothetical protein IKD89_03345 [Clostridia bacterium]|nr:hypothetical protein [Clostridia bacterium]